MKKSNKFFVLLQIFLITASLLLTQNAFALSCVPDANWTNLWHNFSGWTGADGIFSIPLNGNDAIGSATSTTRTMFTFSDTYLGIVDPNTHQYTYGPVMINNSAAHLYGNTPNPSNRGFVYGHKGDYTFSSLYGYNAWTGDGIVVGSNVYLFAYTVDAGWQPTRVDLIKIPIGSNGWPDYTKFTVTTGVNLFYRDSTHVITFGSGICDNTDVDGYVYIYGIRNRISDGYKQLLVARVTKANLPNISQWRFYNNGSWQPNVLYTNND